MSLTSERFGIAPHIHVCVTGAGAVILDVKRNKYFGFGREQSELLAAAVLGWPAPTWQPLMSHDAKAIPRACTELCESLVADGVLEKAAEITPARPCFTRRDMSRDWISIGDEVEVRGQVTLRDVGRFLSAFLWARYSLARRPFCKIVDEIQTTKDRRLPSADRLDVNRLAARVDVFRRLRPLVFAPEGHCLLHALALMRFLGKYQMHPNWVIGVTTQPWGAHSWVQWQDYLLDSNPEKVCAYTPIMTV